MNEGHTTKHLGRQERDHNQGGEDEGVLHHQEVMKTSGLGGK